MTSESAANLGIAGPHPVTLAEGQSPLVGSKRADLGLIIETVLVISAVTFAIRLLARTEMYGTLWLLIPTVLVAAALLPPIIRKDQFAEIGRSRKRVEQAFRLLVPICLAAFGATFAGLWLLKLWGFEPPLRASPPAQGQLLWWLLYQFLYVAVAEEVFFRGYVQSNITRLAAKMKCSTRMRNCIIIVLCAACFAAAHIIVQGRIASALTFLPGLILAYIFVRTKSLLAPIIFHGLANTFYCFAAAALA
ncbi:MAG: CPBP family intramembrane glutamic endopeptidase [Planctomycetota bacterium]|jgi:membrane protease YdiL (CAAX protease family)